MNKKIAAFLYCAICALLIGYYRGHRDDAAGVAALIQILLTGLASAILFLFLESAPFMGFLIGFVTIFLLGLSSTFIPFFRTENLSTIYYSLILECTSFTIIYIIALYRMKTLKPADAQ
jgi:hypothetical protein